MPCSELNSCEWGVWPLNPKPSWTPLNWFDGSDYPVLIIWALSANATAFVLRQLTPRLLTQQPRCYCSGGYLLNTHRPSVGRYPNWSDGSHTETVQKTHRNWAEAWKTSSRLTPWGKFERTEMNSSWPLVDIEDATFQKFRRTTRPTSVGCSPPKAWIVRRRRSASKPTSNHER